MLVRHIVYFHSAHQLLLLEVKDHTEVVSGNCLELVVVYKVDSGSYVLD
jgi:hypothetical protein